MTKLRFLTTAMASVALAALTATPALAQDAPNWGRHMWQGGQGGYFFFGHLMMVGTIVLSVAAVILLVRWLSPGHGHYRYRHGGPSALAPVIGFADSPVPAPRVTDESGTQSGTRPAAPAV